MSNYTIAEDYRLPSKGLIYNKPVNPEVRLRSMLTDDELKRTSPTDRQYKLMSEIIEDCMLEKPTVHVYDMCLGDYQYLLHKLRVVTYGKEYKITTRCPHCGKIVNTTIDLDELNVHEYTEDIKQYLKIHLPVCDKDVELSLMTPRMQDNIELARKEATKKTNGRDNGLLLTLEALISKVDGQVLNTIELEQFVRKLPMRDTNILIKTAEKLNLMIGIDNSVKVCCDGCENEFETVFRITSEFFGPTLD